MPGAVAPHLGRLGRFRRLSRPLARPTHIRPASVIGFRLTVFVACPVWGGIGRIGLHSRDDTRILRTINTMTAPAEPLAPPVQQSSAPETEPPRRPETVAETAAEAAWRGAEEAVFDGIRAMSRIVVVRALASA